MAAIKKKRVPVTNAPTASIIGKKGGQPPPFRATGLGWFNKLPSFPADELIANGYLINTALAKNNKHHKIYLFVNAMQTGWSLSGQTSQAQTSRSFYPHNLAQDELQIEGAVANQYEFDRLVEFVQAHHLSQFNANALTGTVDQQFYPGSVRFGLFRPQTDASLDFHKPLLYDVVIENTPAGHKRFMNFPTWTLTCKVVYDHLDDSKPEVENSMRWATTLKDVFGDVKNPTSMSTGKNSKSAAQARDQAKSQHNHPS